MPLIAHTGQLLFFNSDIIYPKRRPNSFGFIDISLFFVFITIWTNDWI